MINIHRGGVDVPRVSVFLQKEPMGMGSLLGGSFVPKQGPTSKEESLFRHNLFDPALVYKTYLEL